MLKKIYLALLSALTIFIIVCCFILIRRDHTTSYTIEGGNFIVKNGYIYKNGSDEKYNGIIQDTINTRIVNYEVQNGKKNGHFIVYYPSGKMQIQGIMKDNKNNGLWKYYYPSGQLESEGNFKDDLVSDKWTWYYENGKIKESGIFVKGKREGTWTSYLQNGEVKAIFLFKDGNVIDVIDSNKLKSA